jgi:hypothetical protein
MKALTRPRFTGLTFLSLAAAGVVFFSSDLLRPTASVTLVPAEMSIPGTQTPTAAQLLPFTFRDAVRYFETSLAQFPQEIRPDEVVFRGGNHRDNFYTISVVSYGSDVLVRFDVMDDYGMTLVREFFEAPFFHARESEQFYALLDGKTSTKALHLPRFDVLYEYDGRGDGAIISMLFSPRVRTIGRPEEGDVARN